MRPEETDAPLEVGRNTRRCRPHQLRNRHRPVQRHVEREIIVHVCRTGDVVDDSCKGEHSEAREYLRQVGRGFRKVVGLMTEVHSEKRERDFRNEEEPVKRRLSARCIFRPLVDILAVLEAFGMRSPDRPFDRLFVV